MAGLNAVSSSPLHLAARLPHPRRVLSWLYVGRMGLGLTVFVAVAWVWGTAPPDTTLAASLTLIAVAAFTAISFWHTHVLQRLPETNFLYLQILFDTVLVTWAVHLTGGPESTLSPLYILVIFAAALLLPFLGGILIGLLASILYFAAIVWGPYTSDEGTLLLQVTLFAAVALVTGYLGDRLRQTGTALGEVETELRQLRLTTDDILASIETGILTVDAKGRLAYLNPAAAELLSLPAEQWLGRPVIEALNRSAPGMGWVIEHSAKHRHPVRRFETGDLLDGSFVLGVSTTLVEREPSEGPLVTTIFQDITEKKRLDTLERRAERLEAVAELSASLAHEIRNPLASIRSAVEQLTGSEVEPEDGDVLQRLVVRESDRLSRLLTEFLDFARIRVPEREPVNFGVVIREVVQLMRAHPDAEGCSITLRAADEELLVPGAEDLLHRAVLNLVLNGVQWAGPGGQVEVVLERTESDILSPAQGAAPVIRLSVTDDGPGVPPELAEQIFNPFFTRRSGGAGLGLALVQRAVEAHGGAILLNHPRPPEEKGASFTLYLPPLSASAGSPRIG